MGDRPGSAHLRSRHRTAEILAELGSPLTYFRAGRAAAPSGAGAAHHAVAVLALIGLVTPVDAGVARPLVDGLSTPTTVTDSSGAELFDVRPMAFVDALRRALEEDHEAPAPTR